MKWISERISFVDHKESATFVIYPPKIGFKRTLILIWVVLWYIVGGVVLSQLFFDYTEKEKIILLIFLSFWIYFAFRVTKTLIYLFWGREYIKLDQTALRVKKATGKFGSAKQYFIENIAKFKQHEVKENSFQAAFENSPWVKGFDKLQFEYQGKNISFGRKLTEKEAQQVFRLLTKRIEQFLRKK
jgi:Zn-dependent protease with chaperone function